MVEDRAYVELTHPDDAPEDVRAVYDDIQETRDGELGDELNLNDMWLAYGTAPHLLKTFWPHMRDSYRQGELEFVVKSKISLVTANVLECENCRVFHTTRLAEEGVDADEITRLRNQELERSIFSEREYEILRFAETLAADHHAVDARDVDRLRSVGLSEREIVEVIDTVAIHVHAAVFQAAAGVVETEPADFADLH